MNIKNIMWSAMFLWVLYAFSPFGSVIAQAAEAPSKNDQAQSSTANLKSSSGAAAGQAKDVGGEQVDPKLKACLSRIPADSTSGQRLLAEETCHKEQESRSARYAAPQF